MNTILHVYCTVERKGNIAVKESEELKQITVSDTDGWINQKENKQKSIDAVSKRCLRPSIVKCLDGLHIRLHLMIISIIKKYIIF